MSPRKSRYRVPEWRVQLYRDRGKKMRFGPYECPTCGKNSLSINIDKKNKVVTAVCSCGLEAQLDYFPYYEPVDYYNKVVDQAYQARK